MRSVAQGLLRLYKRWLSPLFPPSCRYAPTCSEYAMEAIDGHGVVRGGLMAAWRLLRCHPLAKGGFDPVSRDHLDAGLQARTQFGGERCHASNLADRVSQGRHF